MTPHDQLALAYTKMLATPTISDEVHSEAASTAILSVLGVLNSFDLAEITPEDRALAHDLVNNRLVIDPSDAEQTAGYSAIMVRAATMRHMLEQSKVSIRCMYQHPEFLRVMRPISAFLIHC